MNYYVTATTALGEITNEARINGLNAKETADAVASAWRAAGWVVRIRTEG